MALPKFEIRLDRDEKIIGILREALEEFNEMIERGFNRLCEINGGPPPKRIPLSEAEQESVPLDLIP